VSKREFKVGDRVRVLDSTGGNDGTIEAIDSVNHRIKLRNRLPWFYPRQCVRLRKKPRAAEVGEAKRVERWMNIVNFGFGHNAFYTTPNEARAVAAQNYPACTTTVHLVELRDSEVPVSRACLAKAIDIANEPLNPGPWFDCLCKALGFPEGASK
jgi:hypothetical protein